MAKMSLFTSNTAVVNVVLNCRQHIFMVLIIAQCLQYSYLIFQIKFCISDAIFNTVGEISGRMGHLDTCILFLSQAQLKRDATLGVMPA